MTTSLLHRYISLVIAALFCGTALAQKKAPKELYVPMDYSTCGYHASEARIPDVKVAAYVAWHEGDCSARLQQAIDYVSTLKPDAGGCRGAVLIGEGTFRLDQPLRLHTPGVVLRGTGRDKTTLVKYGSDRGAVIWGQGGSRGQGARGKGQENSEAIGKVISCSMPPAPNPKEKTAASPQELTVEGLQLQKGDRVRIVRPSTKEWIESLRMYDFGGGLDYTGWKPTDIDITWDRTVVAVEGNRVTLDAPLTCTLCEGTTIERYQPAGELTECGIENMTIEAAVNDWNPKDEDHAWDGITMDQARDCWVRRVCFRHLAGSAVNLQKNTSRITVEDCIAMEPVSEVGGWRRCVYLTRGQQTLFQRCISRQGIHDFAAGYCAAGPNAFVQCEGEESLGFSGSIGSWACGLLFDIVNIDGSDLRYANLEEYQFGTGWNTANSMFWQCTASTIQCYSPDSDNRNSAHGCWGTLVGNGEWTESNNHVQPRSLFYDQLAKRLNSQFTIHNSQFTTHDISVEDLNNPSTLISDLSRILVRSTDASSSPTVEQAMRMAQESLTTPRLTLEMWIDSIPYTADVTPGKAGKAGKAGNSGNSGNSGKSGEPGKSGQSEKPEKSISCTGAHLTLGGSLITGNQYAIPWWSGRVKDNFVSKDARPAITRFVPGREGTGWTDRIDSVVSYLSRHRYSSLEHHYGLWYDLRRTDHERVRRADGDVWAPFYEQPFARSGQGTAWDGLSRYDLNRPNEWYWHRLRSFADESAKYGILLFNHHYFQHNILEAGAHWVDCPWRPVNNINGTDFPEPVPFTGDKRIFIAEQFYDERNTANRDLHRQYIRMNLEQLQDQPNTIHLISAEYTGPLHFTRFWLQTIAEWEAETGRHPLIALSCTKDAQDSILADPELSRVVDIIDIRYWHYNTDELWAPAAGKNMAPRQWMRKWKAGKTGFGEVYRAVSEYRAQYPGKAVTYFGQNYPECGWAVLMAGGSLPNVPLTADDPMQAQLLRDVCSMDIIPGTDCVALGRPGTGYLVYTLGEGASIAVAPGKYSIYEVNTKTGAVSPVQKSVRLESTYRPGSGSGKVFWVR